MLVTEQNDERITLRVIVGDGIGGLNGDCYSLHRARQLRLVQIADMRKLSVWLTSNGQTVSVRLAHYEEKTRSCCASHPGL